MASYKVLSNLKHDGVEFVAGDIVSDITDEQAAELVAERVIEPTTAVEQQHVQAGTEQQGTVQL